ncbi:MAG: cyclase, partial [Christensenellales bacterium]
RIQEGDIVILDSNWKFPPFTPETNSPADKRLFINAETAIWMRDHKVKCVGFGDGVSIENCEADVKPFHDIIMAYDGVFLEVLKNLEDLEKDTFFMSYSPLPILGADSCPVRAYAIEGLPGFGG